MSHPFKILELNGFSLSGVLQIGASTGQEVEAIAASSSLFSVLVEPLPKPFAELKKKAMRYKGIVPIQALCSDNTGEEVEFHIADNAGMSSSLLKPTGHLLKIHPEVHFSRKVILKTITVDDMLRIAKERHRLPVEKLDTLLMDVQGAEHLVLKGAEQTLKRVKYVFSEVSYGGLYQNDMPLEKFQRLMKHYGFRMYTLIMNRKGWGDALFVRNEHVVKPID